jgi:hypothetical protein
MLNDKKYMYKGQYNGQRQSIKRTLKELMIL